VVNHDYNTITLPLFATAHIHMMHTNRYAGPYALCGSFDHLLPSSTQQQPITCVPDDYYYICYGIVVVCGNGLVTCMIHPIHICPSVTYRSSFIPSIHCTRRYYGERLSSSYHCSGAMVKWAIRRANGNGLW
jgi:hypothetical protein